jgi:hypothetical protein
VEVPTPELAVEEVVRGIHSLRAGCALYRLVPRTRLVFMGFGYKAVKTIALRGAQRLEALGLPRSRGVHISPPLPSYGGPMGRWIRGWRSFLGGNLPKPVTLEAGGEYYVRLGWAGAEGEEAARSIAEALEASDLAEVETVEFIDERVEPAPTHEATLVLVTPAQFKVVTWTGEELLVTNPSPARLLQAPLRVALEAPGLGPREAHAAMAALTVYTAQTQGYWEPVTVFLDKRRPTTWAIRGWARISLTRGAPEAVGRLLGLLHRLALYIGVGKSRMEGLGMVGESFPTPLGMMARLPCVPWPVEAA